MDAQLECAEGRICEAPSDGQPDGPDTESRARVARRYDRSGSGAHVDRGCRAARSDRRSARSRCSTVPRANVGGDQRAAGWSRTARRRACGPAWRRGGTRAAAAIAARAHDRAVRAPRDRSLRAGESSSLRFPARLEECADGVRGGRPAGRACRLLRAGGARPGRSRPRSGVRPPRRDAWHARRHLPRSSIGSGGSAADGGHRVGVVEVARSGRSHRGPRGGRVDGWASGLVVGDSVGSDFAPRRAERDPSA
jgi:hypothetical protein